MVGTSGCSQMTKMTRPLDKEPVFRAGMWGDPQPISLYELHHQGSQHWSSWAESPHWNTDLTRPVPQTRMKQLRCAACTTRTVSRKRSKPLSRSLGPNLLPWSFLLLSTAHPQATRDWTFPGIPHFPSPGPLVLNSLCPQASPTSCFYSPLDWVLLGKDVWRPSSGIMPSTQQALNICSLKRETQKYSCPWS